jgi:hypothetical protein
VRDLEKTQKLLATQEEINADLKQELMQINKQLSATRNEYGID